MQRLINEWQYVSTLDYFAEHVEDFKDDLRFVVCRDYGWLASELFSIEGELGWGPGFREYEGMFFPPPTRSSYAMMTTFLNTLQRVEKDITLIQMLRNARVGYYPDKPTTLLARTLSVRAGNKDKLVDHFYNKIASNINNTYTIGAARLYHSMWSHQKKFCLAVAGLIRLAFTPLNRISARAETVRRKVLYPRAIIPFTGTQEPKYLPYMEVAC